MLGVGSRMGRLSRVRAERIKAPDGGLPEMGRGPAGGFPAQDRSWAGRISVRVKSASG